MATNDIEQSRRKLYDALTRDGYDDLGDFNAFSSRLEDVGARRKLYDAMVRDGYDDIGDFDAFSNRVYASTMDGKTGNSADASSRGFGVAGATNSNSVGDAQAAVLDVADNMHDNIPVFGKAFEEAVYTAVDKKAGGEDRRETAANQPPQSADAPTWTPGLRHRLRASHQMQGVLDDFDRRSEEGMTKVQRTIEPFSEEGRRTRATKKFESERAGIPATMGWSQQRGNVEADAGTEADADSRRPVVSRQSPVPYGIDSKGKPQWLLPDGTLTTSFLEADRVEYGARRARLQDEFIDRMEANGLDPAKREDVQMQANVDAIKGGNNIDESKREDFIKVMEDNGLSPQSEEHIKWVLKGDARNIIEYRLRRAEDKLKALHRKKIEQENASDDDADFLTKLGRNANAANAHMHPTPPPSQSGVAQSNLNRDIEYATAEVAKMSKALRDYDKSKNAAGLNFLDKIATGLWDGITDVNTWTFGVHDASINHTARNADATTEAGRALLESYQLSEQALADAPDPGALYLGAKFAGSIIGAPETYIGLGFGNAARKVATKAAVNHGARKVAGEVAERYAANSLGARMLGAAAGGGANFFAFEGIGDMRQQLIDGGYTDSEGNFHEGFSIGHALQRGGHGAITGSAMGLFGAGVGNIGNKFVKAVDNPYAKVGIRGGQHAVSFVGEGTIFAIPEIYEYHTMDDEKFDKLYAEQCGYNRETDPVKRAEKRDAARNSMSWDAWTKSQANIFGMKVAGKVAHPGATIGHVSKTLGELRTDGVRHGLSFGEKLSQMMDKSPIDVALTKEERQELRDAGYGELADLFVRDKVAGAASKTEVGNSADASSRGLDSDVERVEAQEVRHSPEFDGYEAMERLMADGRVSEAARAKAYFILTGRMLPMSTVTGYTRIDDGNGNITVNAVTVNGDIVTSRKYTNEKQAQREIETIKRQAELNSIDVGEKYASAQAQMRVAESAFGEVGKKYRTTSDGIRNIYEKSLNGEKLSEIEREIVNEVNTVVEGRSMVDDLSPESLRGRVKERTGIDVDKALRKEPGQRSQEETDAVAEYADMLYHEAARDRMAREIWGEEYERMQQEEKAERRRQYRAMIDGRLLNGGEPQPIGRAVMKYQDRPVEVMSGRVVMMEDGTMVDRGRSDKTVVIRDLKTGKMEMVSPDAILSYEDYAETPEEAATGTEDAVEDAVELSRPEYTSGQIKIRDSDGKESWGFLSGHVDEEGRHEYYLAGDLRKLHYATDEELDAMITEYIPDETEAVDMNSADASSLGGGSRDNGKNKSESEGMTPQFALNDEFTILNDDGMPIRGSITGELDEDGTIEIYTEQPINGNRVNRLSPAELEKMLDTYNGEHKVNPVSGNIETTPEPDKFSEIKAENNLTDKGETLPLQKTEQNDGISERISPTDERTDNSEVGSISRILGYLDSARERAIGGEGSTFGQGAGSRGGTSVSRQEIDARAAETHAKESGQWIPMDKIAELGRPGPSGNENDTYISPDNKYYYKVNNLMNSGGEISRLLEKARLHNEVFLNTAYEYVGMTGFDGRSVYPVLRQRLIADATNATPEDIADYMTSLGYAKTGDNKWSNLRNEVSDLRPRNVLKDKDGDIYVIDAELKKLDTAYSQIPVDEHGHPKFEEADPDTVWEAHVEMSEGDEEIAAEVLADIVEEKKTELAAAEKNLKKLQEGKPEKRKPGEPAPTSAERIAAKKAAREALGEAEAVRDRAQKAYDLWKEAAGTKQRREATAKAEADVALPQEQLSREDADRMITSMERRAQAAPEMELTIENWDLLFGHEGKVDTPIGAVKMGENQFTKLMRQGRNNKLGMVKPTLENPDVIVEDNSMAKDGSITERGSSYVFVKAFAKPDGSRYYYFTSVTVSKEGHEVVISNQEKRRNVLTNLLMKSKMVWKHSDNVSTASDVADGLYSSRGKMSDPVSEGTVTPQTIDNPQSPIDKINTLVSKKQEKTSKSSANEVVVTAEMKAAEEAFRKSVTQGKAELEHAYEEVKNIPEAVEVLRNMEPQTIDEAAALLLTGSRVLWNDEGVKRGVKSMLGYGEAERRGLFGLFATSKNGGETLEHLAEDKMAEMCAQYGIAYDNYDALTALTDVLQACRTRGDLHRYIQNRRIAQAQQMKEDYIRQMEEAAEQMSQEAYHLSVAERDAYEEHIFEELAKKQLTDSEIAEMNAIFADEIIDRQRYENNIRNEQRRAYGVLQGGSEVLQGAQPDNAARVPEAASREGRDAGYGGIDRSHGDAPEGAPRIDERSTTDSYIAKAEKIAELAKKYPNTPVVTVSAEADIKNTNLSKTAKAEIKEALGEPGTWAIYCSEDKQIYIFTQKISDKELKTIFVHENIHAAVDKLTLQNSAELRHWHNSILKLFPEELTADTERLFQEEMQSGIVDEEFLAYSLPWLYNSPKRMSKVLESGDKKLISIFKNINEYVYGKEKSEKRYNLALQGGDSQIVSNGRGRQVRGRRGNGGDADVRTDGSEPRQSVRGADDELTPEEQAIADRVEITDNEWTEGGGDKPTYKRDIVIDGVHKAVQVDAPDERGCYTGSYFEFDGKRFGDIAEIVRYIEGQTSEPTDAQKAAGNYKMGHRRIDGYNISIENAKGSIRRGVGADGKPWETEMRNDYGYIRGTEGVDGDHIDVFLSDTPEDGDVFVVDQVNEDGTFDEHKVMYGFPTEQAAREAYLSNYEPGWQGLGAITHVSKDEFKKWIKSSHRKTKPFAEYTSVKALTPVVLSETQADELLSTMKANAVVASHIEVTEDNWRPSLETPIGLVKMGKNQKSKLFEKGRADQYGMLLGTLSEPDIILEERDREQNLLHERPSSYLFIKTFQKEDDSKYIHFESVTVSREGMEVSISSHIIRENQLKNKMKSDRLLYIATALDESANSPAGQPINQGGSLSSNSKDSLLPSEKQIVEENTNFAVKQVDSELKVANRYETQDGKTINYTSENAEGYGGLFDFDFRGENAGGNEVGMRSGANGLQRKGGAGLNPSDSRLDEKSGEFSVVERVFTESGSFNFTSGERIESADDVAFIFSALEDAAKEHSFVVLVKDGKPTVVELGMGTFTATMVDAPTVSLAYSRIKPDEVYFVHNHPSGNLKCSPQDVQMLRAIEKISNGLCRGVIINLKTGKYGTFDVYNTMETGQKRIPDREVALTVHTLDKQIFTPDYDPMAQPLVRGSEDVAKFLNSHRMGDRAKVSFLIISQGGRIVGNIHTPFTEISADVDDKARYISDRVIQFGGVSAILYGDFDISYEKQDEYRRLKKRMEALGGGIRLLDVVNVEGNHTRSANDLDLLRSYEPGSEYGVSSADNSADASSRGRQPAISQASPEAKREHAEGLVKKLNAPVRIVNDIRELPGNMRDRNIKGFYDTATGEVVIVLPNHADVEDVAATVFHEVVAHKGLREMIGEENYNAFCDEVYNQLKDVLKQQIDGETARRFMNDPSKGYEYHRRVSIDELFGRLSEKGFEDFTEAERGIWAKLKTRVLEAINKFLGSLKLPKGVRLGDNELRYMLWRSHERLRAKGDYVDMARDAAKRDELGLNRSDALRESINNPKRERIEKLRKRDSVVVEDSDLPIGIDLSDRKAVKDALRNRIKGEYTNADTGDRLLVSNKGINEVTSHGMTYEAHVKSLFAIPQMLKNAIYIDSEPNVKGHDKYDSYRYYVCGLKIDGEDYTAKIVVGEKDGQRYYDHRLSKIEKGRLIDSLNRLSNSVAENQSSESESILASTPGTKPTIDSEYKGMTLERLLQVNEPESSYNFRFREGETDDIWKDRSVGLEERITNAAIRLSNNQRDDLTLYHDAMKAVTDNLQSLMHDMRNRRGSTRSFAGADRKVTVGVVDAMNAQAMFDRSTVKRVSDLARILMRNGYLTDMTSGEMQRLLSVVKNATAMHDISDSVQKIMDIMIGNQLRNGEASLRQLLAIRSSKVDARGVEVQGALDVDGQRTMEVVKKAVSLTEDDITDRIAEALNRMSDPDQTIANQAAIEYAGLNMALDYVQNIANSKAEEKALRDGLKTAKEDRAAGRMTDDAYKQFIETTEDAIRKNKIERTDAYFNLVGRLSDSLRGSIENAKAFREAEKARISEIHHNANSDMEGRPTNEHHKDNWQDKFANNGFVQFLFAPLGTFDQIMRVFGNKSANGEGYLWNRFMRGWVDCRNKELRGIKDKFVQLDEKAAELFGKGKTWGDIIRMERKLPKASVSFWDGGEMRDHELTQGNLLYIYMVDKMTDGRMKLRRMGITEQDITYIENFLDPRFKALGDWLQDDFLVATRNEYNETHKRMFGASMAAIENYFPLKILANARIDKEEDVNQQNRPDGITTKTGSIIKRRVNNLALDITGADALSVILDHITQMEHWSAYAEWNRDLNTLRTYKRFRNQVINMTTVYGGGRRLWENFNDLCLMAAGEYRPPIANLDKSAVNFAKGVTAAKVSFRMFTALKQLLSAPAYAPEVSTRAILKSIVNPYGDFKWCMENLPIFRERWHSRISGDPRLLKSDMDWKMWRSRIMELSSRIGMTPNAFVDAVTVSIGAKAMYETRLKQYIKEGYPADAATARAKQDAAILFNQTQQSSESPFLSTMQVDRSWLSVLFTVFRNSAMSYTRQEFDAVRNLKRNLTPGQRAKSIEFMAKQILRDWNVDPESATAAERDKAEGAAKKRFHKQIKKDVIRLATFGFILEMAWNLSPYLPYIIFGDDEDEKDKMWDDAIIHAYFGSVEGLSGGDVLSSFGNMWASGEWNRNQLSKDMPLASDINSIANKFIGGKNAEGINDIINLLVQMGIGMNPQSITDAAIAITDACGDDPALSHEAAIFVMRVLQVPQSQIDKMYFDEIGLSGEEASKLTPEQLAQRYAQYKVKRGTPLAPWSWGDEERLNKYSESAKDRMKERLDAQGDASMNEAYADFEARYKAVSEKVKVAKALMRTDYAAAAQAHAALQQDPDFTLYQRFGSLDKQLGRISKMWLTSKTPEEAALIASTIPAYRASMVKVLQAETLENQQSAMSELTTLMNEFYSKYQAMQPAPQQLNR